MGAYETRSGLGGRGTGGGFHDFPAAEALKRGDGLIVVDSGDAVEVRKVLSGEVPDGWSLKDYAVGTKATMVIAGEIKKMPVVGAGGALGLPFSPGTLYWDLINNRATTVETDGLDCGALLESEWLFPEASAGINLNNTDGASPLPFGSIAESYPGQLKNIRIQGKTAGTDDLTLLLPQAENFLAQTVAVDESPTGSEFVATNTPVDMGEIDDPAITRVPGAGGFVYRLDESFTGNLRIRFDGTWDVGVGIQLRRGTSIPPGADGGGLVGSATNTGNNFSGDFNIASAQAREGTYFWFALSSNSITRTITNRRLRLDGSWNKKDLDWFVKAGDGAIFWLPANASRQTTLDLIGGSGNFKLADGTLAPSIVLASGHASPQIVYLVSDGTHWVRQSSGWLKNTAYLSHHMLIAGRTGGGGIETLDNVSTTDQAAYTATDSGGTQPEEDDVVLLTPAGLFDFNTGAATLALNGGAAKAVKNQDGDDFTGGEIRYGAGLLLRYNGTEWRSLNETRPDFDDTVTKTVQAYSKSYTTPGGGSAAGNIIPMSTGSWDESGVIATKTLLGGTLFVLETPWAAVRFVVAAWNTAGEDIDIWYKDDSDPSSITDGTQLAALGRTGASLNGQTVSDDNAPAGRRYWFRVRNAGNGLSTGNRQLQITSNANTFDLSKTVPGRFGYGLEKKNNKIGLPGLAGSETDRYGSYTNAFMAAGYRRGAISFFNRTTVPTDDTDAIGQPNIADNSDIVVVLSAFLRTDRDPNNLQWATKSSAADYPSGRVLYFQIWNDKSAHAKVTLKSAGTFVDGATDDGDFIWFRGSIDEVNDLPDVADFGNYFLISDEEPTDLKIRIPISDVLGVPTGQQSDPITGGLEFLTTDFKSFSLNHLERHFSDGYDTFSGYAVVASGSYDANGEIDASVLGNFNPQIRLGIKAAHLYDLAADAVAGALIEVRKDASNYILGKVTTVTTDSLGSAPSNGRYVNLEHVEKIGTIGAGDTVEIRVYKGGALEQIALTSGTARDTLTATTRRGEVLAPEGRYYLIQPNRSNGGAATLALNGGAAYPIMRRDGTACTGGELPTGKLQPLFFTGAAWLLLNDLRADYPIRETYQKAAFDTGFPSVTVAAVGANAAYTLPASFTNHLSVDEVISHKALNGGTLITLLARFPKFGVAWNTSGNNVQLYYKDGADPSSVTDGTVQAWSGGTNNRYLDATDWPQGRRFWFVNNGAALGSGVRTIKILSGHDPDPAEAVFHDQDVGGRWKKYALAALTGVAQDLVTNLLPDDYLKIVAISDDGISGAVEGAFKDLEDRSAAGTLRIPIDGILDKYEGSATSVAATILSGCAGRDLIEIGVRLTGGSGGSNNIRLASSRLRYTDMSANSWLPDNPVDGDRIQFSKSGSNLQVQTAGTPENVQISAVRRSEQTAILTLGSSKVQARRNAIGPPCSVDCWVLEEGE